MGLDISPHRSCNKFLYQIRKILEDYYYLTTLELFFHRFRKRIAEKENLALLNLKESVS